MHPPAERTTWVQIPVPAIYNFLYMAPKFFTMSNKDLILQVGGSKEMFLLSSPLIEEFPEKTFEEVVSELEEKKDEFSSVEFFGGEVTGNTKFFDLIEEASKRGYRVEIVSDCIKFADKEFTRKAVDKGLDFVSTELHGESELHNEYVESQVFEKVLEGVSNLADHGVELEVGSFLTKKSLKELNKLGEKLSELGVDIWTLIGVMEDMNLPGDYEEITPDYVAVCKFIKNNKELLESFESVKLMNYPMCVAPVKRAETLSILPRFMVDKDLGNESSFKYANIDVCEVCEFFEDCEGFMEKRLETVGKENVRELWKLRLED